MQDLSSKHIIPHMELKIRILNQQVLFKLLIHLQWACTSKVGSFELLFTSHLFFYLLELRSCMCAPSEEHSNIYFHQVSATRKGFRNQIKNLWWRKGKEDGPDYPSGPTYDCRLGFHTEFVLSIFFVLPANSICITYAEGTLLAPLNLK